MSVVLMMKRPGGSENISARRPAEQPLHSERQLVGIYTQLLKYLFHTLMFISRKPDARTIWQRKYQFFHTQDIMLFFDLQDTLD